MRKTRLVLFALVATVALAIGGSASATGPSGSEDDGDNETTCAEGTSVDNPEGGSLLTVYVDEGSIETCSDDGVPLDGRIIATMDDGGYVAADGDASNPEQLQGWVRVDSDGSVSCGPDGDHDSTDGGGTIDDCGDE